MGHLGIYKGALAKGEPPELLAMLPNQMFMLGALVDVSSRLRQDRRIGEIFSESLIL